ncbi:uncharacterized protein LOC107028558 isoform X2 [Solanum pennellii]|uniref:Uncharacterized protein LOC107028558 isoform X2 n=1 Tax=Solanum pennellii TaxID=28526 RepID=A0ABM1HGC3_SOLPN|nr:uncharacterized protein LOC101245084 isoform X2 [Solanum lycopersicum]XP_015085150.1 uncharacterized protein LOC107028558 isoform X2 [Solanum pennellii]
MYRSSSSSRVSEEFFFNSSPNLKSTISTETEELPTFNPQSHVAKKERNRLRSAENAIHLIPLILLLSAIVLWVFSSPVTMVNKADSIVARLNVAVNQPEIHEDSSKTSFTSKLELEDIDATDKSEDQSEG